MNRILLLVSWSMNDCEVMPFITSLFIRLGCSRTLLGRLVAIYLFFEEQAKRILSEVKAAMRQWRKVATACHISPAEQQRFASRLDLFI